MGSSGTGMFGTYREEGGGAFSTNGENGGEMCPRSIDFIRLEDVAESEYYQSYNNVPPIGQTVNLSPRIINKRLAVVLSDTNETIGNLPVTYNQLNLCMKKGMTYSGTVRGSGIKPIPYVVVDLYA